MELLSKGKNLTHRDAVNSSFPVLVEMTQVEKDMIKAHSFTAMVNYLELYHPGTNAGPFASEIIELIFSEYYTLNAVDIPAFIRFMKFNKPETSGHKITPAEMIESLKDYLKVRAVVIEEKHHQAKYEQEKTPLHPKVAKAFDDLLKRMEEKQKGKVKAVNEKVDYKFKGQKERMEYYKNLRNRRNSGEITDEQAGIEWNNFLQLQNPIK